MCGAALGLALGGAAAAAPTAMAWLVTPGDATCKTELELVGRSGAVTPVTLVSDGEILSLKFAKADLPERAFLPIRIDRERFSNLMLRTADPAVGELVLSEETQVAMRRGKTLDIAWLAEEPRSVSLAGSEQGLVDLRTCGAQAAVQHRTRVVAEQEARARAEAQARAAQLQEAQLAAARAEAAAAEAQRRRVEEESERRRLAELEERRRQAYLAEQEERRRAYEEEQERYYRPAPQPVWPQPAYPYRRW